MQELGEQGSNKKYECYKNSLYSEYNINNAGDRKTLTLHHKSKKQYIGAQSKQNLRLKNFNQNVLPLPDGTICQKRKTNDKKGESINKKNKRNRGES